MKRLYIVGNGFDLNHNLKTSYRNYKKYLKGKDKHTVYMFDQFLKDVIKCDDYEIENWSELEKYTGELFDVDTTNLVKNILERTKEEYDTENMAFEVENIIPLLTNWMGLIRSEFQEWIKTIDLDSASKKLTLDTNAMYLSFNYTDTLEKVYGIDSSRVFHIHGDKTSNIIFGNNVKRESYLKYDLDYNSYPEFKHIRKFEVLSYINVAFVNLQLFYKNSKFIIEENNDFFESIDECEEIIFMGFSCGSEDQIYLDEIIEHSKNLKKVVVYSLPGKSIEYVNTTFISKLKSKVDVEIVEW